MTGFAVLTGCLKGCGVVLGGVSMLDCLTEAKLALRDWSIKKECQKEMQTRQKVINKYEIQTQYVTLDTKTRFVFDFFSTNTGKHNYNGHNTFFLLCSLCCFSNAVVTLNTFYDPHLIFNISRVDHFCTLSQIITMSLSVCWHYPGAAVETYRKRRRVQNHDSADKQATSTSTTQNSRWTWSSPTKTDSYSLQRTTKNNSVTVWKTLVCSLQLLLLPNTWIPLESSWK